MRWSRSATVPAYYQDARSFIVLVDTTRQEFVAGDDATGDGTA